MLVTRIQLICLFPRIRIAKEVTGCSRVLSPTHIICMEGKNVLALHGYLSFLDERRWKIQRATSPSGMKKGHR